MERIISEMRDGMKKVKRDVDDDSKRLGGGGGKNGGCKKNKD